MRLRGDDDGAMRPVGGPPAGTRLEALSGAALRSTLRAATAAALTAVVWAVALAVGGARGASREVPLRGGQSGGGDLLRLVVLPRWLLVAQLVGVWVAVLLWATLLYAAPAHEVAALRLHTRLAAAVDEAAAEAAAGAPTAAASAPLIPAAVAAALAPIAGWPTRLSSSTIAAALCWYAGSAVGSFRVPPGGGTRVRFYAPRLAGLAAHAAVRVAATVGPRPAGVALSALPVASLAHLARLTAGMLAASALSLTALPAGAAVAAGGVGVAEVAIAAVLVVDARRTVAALATLPVAPHRTKQVGWRFFAHHTRMLGAAAAVTAAAAVGSPVGAATAAAAAGVGVVVAEPLAAAAPLKLLLVAYALVEAAVNLPADGLGWWGALARRSRGGGGDVGTGGAIGGDGGGGVVGGGRLPPQHVRKMFSTHLRERRGGPPSHRRPLLCPDAFVVETAALNINVAFLSYLAPPPPAALTRHGPLAGATTALRSVVRVYAPAQNLHVVVAALADRVVVAFRGTVRGTNDVVSTAPPLPWYRHAGRLVLLDRTGNLWVEPLAAVARFFHRDAASVVAHSLGTYLLSLARVAEVAFDLPPPAREVLFWGGLPVAPAVEKAFRASAAHPLVADGVARPATLPVRAVDEAGARSSLGAAAGDVVAALRVGAAPHRGPVPVAALSVPRAVAPTG
ncbi:hypothetical protein I4F81_012660 [Pyropia yezoensis]|uniref:Uncharacterized protein n=1 Tax=Pyropia yezoensis TaxID=2788 RepID=A0ACC3CJZ8_PYRYE|nr:hypothetical protein I4F81_012660 [Neopyropia yezoensis]